jgi:hypothetical protein
MMSLLLALLFQITTAQRQQVLNAANKFMPGITWQAKSVLIGDFSCRGRSEQAILGTSHSETARRYAVAAIFLDGLDKQPELFFDDLHITDDVKLIVESLDFDPQETLGHSLQGFKRSKTCKGLNMDDNQTDSLHIYWDAKSRDFDAWRP